MQIILISSLFSYIKIKSSQINKLFHSPEKTVASKSLKPLLALNITLNDKLSYRKYAGDCLEMQRINNSLY